MFRATVALEANIRTCLCRIGRGSVSREPTTSQQPKHCPSCIATPLVLRSLVSFSVASFPLLPLCMPQRNDMQMFMLLCVTATVKVWNRVAPTPSCTTQACQRIRQDVPARYRSASCLTLASGLRISLLCIAFCATPLSSFG